MIEDRQQQYSEFCESIRKMMSKLLKRVDCAEEEIEDLKRSGAVQEERYAHVQQTLGNLQDEIKHFGHAQDDRFRNLNNVIVGHMAEDISERRKLLIWIISTILSASAGTVMVLEWLLEHWND